MDPRLVDIALRKQRLQLRAEAQREDMTARLAGIEAGLSRLDVVRDQLSWAKEKVPLLSIGVITVLLFKPRLTLRLARRAWLGWLLLRQARGSRLLPFAVPVLRRLLRSLKRALSA
ncbi:YqjK-like family protein [Thauera sp. Sel9]|uniref:YqjK-like family protein n=1 Tax=Thauera sp. Sel9 TaxID=2974299 RepID=UPI0021E11BD6|nr:YqjK-like family protein [Thauera sp. Sel9]MCV2217207.1 YqjK-like family protein [Thauera sp. Sel9]